MKDELLNQVAKDQGLPVELLEDILRIELDLLDLDADADEAVHRIEELLERRLAK
jgi:hypothetical protein